MTSRQTPPRDNSYLPGVVKTFVRRDNFLAGLHGLYTRLTVIINFWVDSGRQIKNVELIAEWSALPPVQNIVTKMVMSRTFLLPKPAAVAVQPSVAFVPHTHAMSHRRKRTSQRA